jgi:hypothetical protein
MDRRGVLKTGDIIRIIASFLFINIMFIVFIPLDPVYIMAVDLILILFLALFINIRLPGYDKG